MERRTPIAASDILDPVANVLGVAKGQRKSPLTLIETIENGLPVRSLERVASVVCPHDSSFRFRLVPKATLERRKKRPGSRLSADESARVARVAKVWSAALDVWKNDEAARGFLLSPHMLLGGRKPLDVAVGTDLGARLVEEILGRLQYGTAP